jgi:serine/threonine-protein kinase RsbW
MLTARFPGRYENLAKITQFVSQAAQSTGLNKKELYEVLLAVEEACANIIDHAYKGEGRGEIDLTCEPIEEGFRVILRDQGQPFDPDAIPNPDFSVPLEDLKPGGAGLFLMRKLMDDVSFDFGTSAGNVLTMTKLKGAPV